MADFQEAPTQKLCNNVLFPTSDPTKRQMIRIANLDDLFFEEVS